MLVDASSYLDARDDHPFGSARDPGTSDDYKNPDRYIPLGMVSVRDPGAVWSVERVTDELREGGRVVVLGDYGAGKSMTLREAHRTLAADYRKRHSHRFPIHLNLRDHKGQTDATEALVRHAQKVGFAHPKQLIRAWKAGYAIVLLDGFDEVAIFNWATTNRSLQQARSNALQLVREFVRDGPRDAGVLIAGRQHYFDSDDERRATLGLSGDARQLTLNEFTEEQIKEYLGNHHYEGELPAWLPGRPLLLGYLATRGMLLSTLQAGEQLSPAAGWDLLLDSVCAREARIEAAGIDGSTVRRVLERIASGARGTDEGLGPVYPKDTAAAFEGILRYPPDDDAMVLLQRLPGLGAQNAEDGSRYFIDPALADAARAGDAHSYAADPYTSLPGLRPDVWTVPLGDLGVELLTYKNDAAANGYHSLACDLARAMWQAGGIGDTRYITIQDQELDALSLEDTGSDLSKVAFQGCVIRVLHLEATTADRLPRFKSCLLGRVVGAKDPKGLPHGVFDDACSFEAFEASAATTSGILALNELPLGARVALTVLKKLYVQRGAGRRDGALYRGLDQRAQRYVPEVLGLLQREQLAIKSRQGTQVVWLPERSSTGRVRKMLASPAGSADPLIQAVRN